MTRPLPPRETFARVMERTLELTGQKVSPKRVRALSEIFKTLCWEFSDYDVSVYTVVDGEGRFYNVPSIEGRCDAQITMEARRFHNVVYGRENMPKMFLTGQIKTRGLPTVKLIKFAPLLAPLLESYKEACEELGGQP